MELNVTSKNTMVSSPSAAKSQLGVETNFGQLENMEGVERVDTLYSAVEQNDFIARKTEPMDVEAAMKLINKETRAVFTDLDVGKIYERSCFSLVIADVVEPDMIVAAACFSDSPMNENLKVGDKKWKQDSRTQGMTSLNTFFFHFFASSPEVPTEVCLAKVIANTFNSCIPISFILLEAPSVKYEGSFLFSSLSKTLTLSLGTGVRKKLFVYEKDTMFPPIIMREGREHDLDDLEPLLPMDETTLLTQFGKPILSDVIALSDRNNQSIVAEWESVAVGILTVTTDIDYDLMNKYFQLEPFHGLFKPHPTDKMELTPKVSTVQFDLKDVSELFSEDIKDDFEADKLDFTKSAMFTPPPVPPVLTEPILDNEKGEDAEIVEQIDFDCDDYKLDSYALRYKVIPEPYLLKSPSNLTEVPSQSTHEVVVIDSTEEANRRLEDILEEIDEGYQDDDYMNDSTNVDKQGESGDEKKSSMSNIYVAVNADQYSSDNSAGDCMEFGGMGVLRVGKEGKVSRSESSLDSHTHSKMTSAVGSKAGSSVHPSESVSDIGSGSSLGSLSKSDDLSLSRSGLGGSGSHKSGSSSDGGSLSDHEFLSISDSGNPTASSPSGSNLTLSFHSSKDGDADVNPMDQHNSPEAGEEDESKIASAEADENTEITASVEKSIEPTEAEDWPDYIKAQADLIDAADELMRSLNDAGLDLKRDRDELPEIYYTIFREADLYIRDAAIQCMPKALASEKVLPLEMMDEARGSVYHGIPNAIAIQICALDQKFQMRIKDLIKGVFHNFPNREYIIVTIPLGSKEPYWLDEFVRVSPRKQSLYSREMFVLHRVTLNATIIVRETKPRDSKKVQNLVESLYDKYKVFTDYEEALSSKADDKVRAFVAVVTNYPDKPIIALAIVSVDKRMALYQVNYDLDRYTYIDFHGKSKEGQLYLHHFVINPLFQRFSKLFMKEIFRLTDMTCCFHAIFPDCEHNEVTERQTILNNLDDMIPLVPRKIIDYYHGLNLKDKYDDDRCPPEYIRNEIQGYSVMHFAKKFSFDPKCNLNERIVFIGASDTTISCLEVLIASPYRHYKHITIVDPFGLPGTLPQDSIRDMFFIKKGGKAMSFQSDAERTRRVGIHNLVNVVYGWVTKILRQKKLLVVNKNTLVPYDILIIAPGLQFHRPDCPTPEIEDPHFSSLKKHTKHIANPQPSAQFNRLKPKPKNVFVINTEAEAAFALSYLRAALPLIKQGYILVHGLCLESLACIRALLALGISPQRIVLLTAPKEVMSWQHSTGYVMTPTLEAAIMKTIGNLKINVFEKYVFKSWWLDEMSLLVRRVYFDSLQKKHRISFPCMAFFSFCHKRVHDIIVGALTEAYIFFKEGEGIIIDTKFRTIDPNVWAAGPATVYQMSLKAERNKHAYFQSEEIGHRVAESLIRATQNVGGSVLNLDLVLPPELKNPLIRAARLPGGWHYFYMSQPGFPMGCRPAECDPCETGTEITTGSLEESPENPRPKYFRLWLDGNYRVEGVECLSRKRFSPSNLAGMYGMHESLLNKLLEKMEKGEVTDLYDHFCQPWFGVFCHDRWPHFQQELRRIYSAHTTGDDNVKFSDFVRDYLTTNSNGDVDSFQVDPNILRHIWESSGLKTKVENCLLDFLIFNRTAVPMYARPDFVEKVLEERKASTMYQAKPQKY